MEEQSAIPEEQGAEQQPVVTVGQWLKLFSWLLLLFIPVAGWITIIAVYFIKLTSPQTPAEIRNFLKAYGAFILISLAIGIVMSVIFYHTLMPSLFDYIDGLLPGYTL